MVIRLCYQNQIPVMLNPAPAVLLSDELIRLVTYLTPNEHEVGILFGDNGKSIEAQVVDTTGAGDTFCGVLAQCIVEGKSLLEAVRTAQYASGLSVEKFGAQTGMPRREEVEVRMSK